MGTEKRTWLKKPGGSMTLEIDGQTVIINGGQTFKAAPEEIPAAFMDLVQEASAREPGRRRQIEAATGDVPSAVDDAGEIAKPDFEIVPDETPGWYNIVNKAIGKQINGKKLRAEEAQKMVESLTTGDAE